MPLSDLGRRQSEAVARVLAPLGIEALYSSPLRRAMETAEIVAGALGLEIQTDPRLVEVDVGEFQHKLRSELEQEYPQELARWRSGDLDYRLPGGESRRDLMVRGRAALEAIVEAGLQRVAVVSHGRLLTVTLKDLLGIPPREPPLALQNASITTVSRDAAGHWKLVALDQIEHLRGVGFGSRGDL